jgi:allophanate hydrolase
LSLTVADAQRVLRATQGYDTADPYSRRERTPRASSFGDSFYFGIPAKAQLEFFHDSDAERQFDQSVARMRSIGGASVEIDFSPFLQAARLLYGGPWTAERFTAIKSFLVSHESELLPVIRDIILPAASYTAVQTFDAMYALESLKQQTAATWAEIDMLLVPTIPTIYRIEEVDADPIRLNANLGYYTNFVNLLDLCGVAIPSGIRDDGLPAGMTMLAPALNEDALCRIAARCHAAAALPLGATGNFASKDALDSLEHLPTGAVYLAVVGAHLSGQPLNHQLTDRGGTLVRQCRTAPGYRLYALGASVPSKPGLKRTNETALAGIEVEIWALPITELGAFTAEVPSPLGIGTITLEDGEEVKGFVCETYAFETALDISHYGGWRNYLSTSEM